MNKLYLWIDIEGKCAYIIGKNKKEVKNSLFKQGRYPLKVSFKCWILAKHFKRQELIIITRQLATMLKAGLPIIESLTLIAKETDQLQWQYVLQDLTKQLMKGESLSDALLTYHYVFPAIYKEIIATGELTGQLDECLEELAQQLEKTQILHKNIKKSMHYPIFLFVMTLLVTIIMLLVVLPKFTAIYQSFDAQLPLFTRSIIALSDFIQQHLIIIIIALFWVVISYRYYFHAKYYYQIEKWLLHLPIVGKLITTQCLAQFFTTLSMTEKSGIPLLTGIQAAHQVINNQQYRLSLSMISDTIKQGFSFSHALANHSLFPTLCIQLIRVGEESGNLTTMLIRLGEYYQQKNSEQTLALSQKIEPLMMSIMAIMIGSLVIAMYLPIFQLGEVIH